jgi:hypothetical protein
MHITLYKERFREGFRLKILIEYLNNIKDEIQRISEYHKKTQFLTGEDGKFMKCFILEESFLKDFIKQRDCLQKYKNAKKELKMIIEEYVNMISKEKFTKLFGDISSLSDVNVEYLLSLNENNPIKITFFTKNKKPESSRSNKEILGKSNLSSDLKLKSGLFEDHYDPLIPKNSNTNIRLGRNILGPQKSSASSFSSFVSSPSSASSASGNSSSKAVNKKLLLPNYEFPVELNPNLSLNNNNDNACEEHLYFKSIVKKYSGTKRIYFLISYKDYSFCYDYSDVDPNFNMDNFSDIFREMGGVFNGDSYGILRLDEKKSVFCIKREDGNILENDVLFFGKPFACVQPTKTLSQIIDDKIKNSQLSMKNRPIDYGIKEYKSSKKNLPEKQLQSFKPFYEGKIKVRGDGDCYYHSFFISLLTSILYGNYSEETVSRWLEIVKKSFLNSPVLPFFENLKFEMSYVDFLVNYFRYNQQLIYIVRTLLAESILEKRNWVIQNTKVFYKENINEQDVTLESTLGGNALEFVKNVILKKNELIDAIVETDILPQIFNAGLLCLFKNATGAEYPELEIYDLKNEINAPVSMFLQTGHYDVYVLSQNLKPNDKTYEKLEWYSKEILINQKTSNKNMAQAEINIWNMNPTKQIPQKDTLIYERINEYINNLPFLSLKKSYLRKIYLGMSQPPFWKPTNDKLSSDFMTLESKLKTIQDMRESEFSPIYKNNYPIKHFNKESINKISTDSQAIIKKLVIQDLIEKSELSERYKNYFIKYYNVLDESITFDIAMKKYLMALKIHPEKTIKTYNTHPRIIKEIIRELNGVNHKTKIKLESYLVKKYDNSMKVSSKASSSSSASGNSSKASSSSKVRNSRETSKLVNEAMKKYEKGLQTYVNLGMTLNQINKQTRLDIIKQLNGVNSNIKQELIKKIYPLTPLEKAINEYKIWFKTFNKIIKEDREHNAEVTYEEKAGYVDWLTTTEEIKEEIKRMIKEKKI